jgi:hypothetical protein
VADLTRLNANELRLERLRAAIRTSKSIPYIIKATAVIARGEVICAGLWARWREQRTRRFTLTATADRVGLL